MKQTKMLAAVLAASAMVVLASAGTASATVLCKEAKSPCPSVYGVGTELKTELVEGTFVVFETVPWLMQNYCSKSSLIAKVTNAGGATAPVTLTVSSATVSSCQHTVEIVKVGTLKIVYDPESSFKNRVAASGFEWKEGSCAYSASDEEAAAIESSSLTGTFAKLDMNMLGAGAGGLFCEEGDKWQALNKILTPNPLNVEPS